MILCGTEGYDQLATNNQDQPTKTYKTALLLDSKPSSLEGYIQCMIFVWS
jgi:hypothetical protein